MRNTAYLAACLVFTAVLAVQAADKHPLLGQVQKVYLLSMTSGYDQYLANQITGQAVMEVVTDPKLADAVLTEAIGTAFEEKLNELLPPPEPEVKETDTKDKDASTDVPTTAPLRTTSFSRGRGNLFLVELKSRSVVWSTYRLPKDRTPQELDKTARRVVDELGRDRGKAD